MMMNQFIYKTEFLDVLSNWLLLKKYCVL